MEDQVPDGDSAEAGETDLSMKSLPSKKRGQPLLLGEKMDTEVKSYISAVREGGGVVTSAIYGSCNSHCKKAR